MTGAVNQAHAAEQGGDDERRQQQQKTAAKHVEAPAQDLRRCHAGCQGGETDDDDDQPEEQADRLHPEPKTSRHVIESRALPSRAWGNAGHGIDRAFIRSLVESPIPSSQCVDIDRPDSAAEWTTNDMS